MPSTVGRADIKEAWAVWGGQGDRHRYIYEEGPLEEGSRGLMSGPVSEWAAGKNNRRLREVVGRLDVLECQSDLGVGTAMERNMSINTLPPNCSPEDKHPIPA